jgi:hypothetical protein
VAPAQAGHEATAYPAFYPQEIRLEVLPPAQAAREIARGRLHAFVGGDLLAAGALHGGVPTAVVRSLAAYRIVRLTPEAAQQPRTDRCRRLDAALSTLARRATRGHDGFVFHPYPVTPYHEDFLAHADRARAARAAAAARLMAGASGVVLEEVAVADLTGPPPLGWVAGGALPWRSAGWFHAYRLLERWAGAAREEAATIFRHLTLGAPLPPDASQSAGEALSAGGRSDLARRLNLERHLVALLQRECLARVAGYLLRREVLTTHFSAGVENVGFDAHAGLASPTFVRTVKLKEFPWNGWLRLGVAAGPTAAWNPVAGFTDPFGTLVWAAVGDPALLPVPYGSGWVENRVRVAVLERRGILDRLLGWLRRSRPTDGEVAVPRDALLPDATGALRAVGRGRRAALALRYRVRTSHFHDGTAMTAADLLAAYAFAFRWGAPADGASDRTVVERTALLREWLAGVRPAGTELERRQVGDRDVDVAAPVVEVYLRRHLPPEQAAVVAPPWTPVPWTVLVLMDEAVRRGLAAFSRVEAARRGVPWLDLVRNPILHRRLLDLAATFEREAYVPPALQPFVTAEEARARWRALRQFGERHGHLLVANGPYRLTRWTPHTAVLTVWRDLSYPITIGTYDRFADPRHAYVTEVHVSGRRVELRGEVERVVRYQRTTELVRHPIGDLSIPVTEAPPECRYVVVDRQGRVTTAGTCTYAGQGAYQLDLGEQSAAAGATLYVGLVVDRNAVGVPVRLVKVAQAN